jgi:hypothetical protein
MRRQGDTPDDRTDSPGDESIRLAAKMSVLVLWPEKFVAVFGCFFRRKSMA